MLKPDEIIILHTTPYSEKSMVIHTLSKTYGRRSFLVKNAGRYITQFQPLNILECIIAENPKSSLFTAKDFSTSVPLSGIRCSAGKNAISMFVAEILLRALQEGEGESGLFEWCTEEIRILDALKQDYANFHLRFLLDFAGALGFRPDLESLLPFLDSSAMVVSEFMSRDFSAAMLVPMNGRERSEICRKILDYLEFHLESRLNIRSLAVLSELF